MPYQKSAEKKNDEEQQFKQDSIAYLQKIKGLSWKGQSPKIAVAIVNLRN